MTNIFTDAKTVMFNNKEVKNITTSNGGVVWEKEEKEPVYLTFTVHGTSININSFGTDGNVIIDWGDGTTETVNSSSTTISHTYSDGTQSYTPIFRGTVTKLRISSNLSIYTKMVIPSTIRDIFLDLANCNNFDLYWEGYSMPPLQYWLNPTKSYSFTIPQGTTSLYVSAGYPQDSLRERSG